MTTSRVLRPPRFSVRLSAAVLAAVLVLGALSGVVRWEATLVAQAASPCTLLTTDEIQPLAPKKVTVSAGVATSIEAAGSTWCQYTWGEGARRFKLDLAVNDASKMFSGSAPDAIKQRLQSAVAPGTADAVVTDVGDVAVFKADSAMFVHATAYVKGRILQVQLDGFDAVTKKDDVIKLLKSAASKL